MTRTRSVCRCTALLAAAGLALLPAGVAAAAPSTGSPSPGAPTPSPGATTVTRAGTSFLGATAIDAGQPVRVDASTGDHLYWSFEGSAGESHQVTVTIGLPAKRSGAATWTVDVFDGLRRRQACTAGAQTPTVAATAQSVSLGCTLREVRSWAEPWSGDPLPGTYYVRLAVVDLPEPDLGLPIEVELLVTAEESGDARPEDGSLAAPLVPPVRAGTVQTGSTPAADPARDADSDGDGDWWPDLSSWLPDLSSRWIWTAAGGVLAAVAGVFGFSLTRRPRR